MKQLFKIPVGLSDHSREPEVGPMAAVALGANCIEKHFTSSNHLPGPDHRFALEPKELKLMIKKIRDVEQVLGTGVKKTLDIEKELHQFARRSIFTVKPIKKGELFTKENIATLRCGNQKGKLKPIEYKKLLNRKALRNIAAHEAVGKKDYAVPFYT
jgi:N-acetylneuraminate synthase